MNYRLLIQYDGTDFHGWQVQENDRTIQGELERVIGMIADTEVAVVGSGRADAGVHAEGQVANVHLHSNKFTPDKLKHAINGNLWRDIRIMKAEQAQGVMIEFRISASGFLRYMARSIIGTMLEVGRGEKDSDTIQSAIIDRDRDLAGKTAPAQGLTLLRVDYD